MAEVTPSRFQAAVDYILTFADYERISRSAVVFDLARVEALLERLGQPHLQAKTVHVAGTKGKGSTSAMIASILTAAGYKTGLYTSPHLLSFTERIQVDRRPVSKEQFASLAEKVRPEVEAVNRDGGLGELTTFEILTAMAFVQFADARVDHQVLEAGLGGRLDATNVIQPQVCAVTSISYDHTEILGDTLAKIAREKAGIIKPGICVVSAPQAPEASAVIEEVCREKKAPLFRVGKEITWENLEGSDACQRFRLRGLNGEYDLEMPLLGEHQVENAAVAIACAEILASAGAAISPLNISRGLLEVHWPGRLQVLRRRPLLVVDGAHNDDSVRKLGKALKDHFVFDCLLMIVGASQEKNVAGIVREIAAMAPRVIVTRSGNPRAAPVSRLCEQFLRYGVDPVPADNVPLAVDKALAMAGERDLICATGSLFVVAEILEYLQPR